MRDGRSVGGVAELHAAFQRDTILVGDCVEELEKLPSRSVDLVFADPPYNLQLSNELHRPDQSRVDGVDDEWDRFADFASLRRVHPRLARRMPAGAEAERRRSG